MIRTIVIPQNNRLQVSIPPNYIGKELEVFIYAKEELEEPKVQKKTAASRFKGLLTANEADQYHHYIDQTREQWQRDI